MTSEQEKTYENIADVLAKAFVGMLTAILLVGIVGGFFGTMIYRWVIM